MIRWNIVIRYIALYYKYSFPILQLFHFPAAFSLFALNHFLSVPIILILYEKIRRITFSPLSCESIHDFLLFYQFVQNCSFLTFEKFGVKLVSNFALQSPKPLKTLALLIQRLHRREQQHIPNCCRIRHHHYHPVNPKSNSAGRRHTNAERI